MTSKNKAEFDNYWTVILRAGEVTTREDLVSHIQGNVDALDRGELAAMRLLVDGSLKMEDAFTLLEASKGIATRNLMYRTAARRAGEHFDFIVSRLDPGQISYYLKLKPHPTAVVSFHFIGRDRLAIFVVANTPTGSNIRGFGDIYYDCLWLDGLRDEAADTLEAYSRSVAAGIPNRDLARRLLDFLSPMVFCLLLKPSPIEVIFLPHKLLHILPLHAASVEIGGKRVYLHDQVRAIQYASSFYELTLSGIPSPDRENRQDRKRRFLSVLDEGSALGGVNLELKWINFCRAQLEPQGIGFDVVTNPKQLPRDYRDYIWATWSSHARSSPNSWGDSFLILGDRSIRAFEIASEWEFNLQPIVMLAACETSIDTSGGLRLDEYCGLDLAFRIAGARSAIASLWPVEDLVAAFTAMVATGWWLKHHTPPAESICTIQRALRTGTWKGFLLRDDQLEQLPKPMAEMMREVQEPFWRLEADVFCGEESWAAFRNTGR